MGNSTSSGRGHHEETVDFGHLTPQGVYTGSRDWNQSVVAQLICERRLAPFYRPLEDYDESWDEEQILAHRKEPPQDSDSPAEASSSRGDTGSISSSRSHKRGHVSTNSKEVIRYPEAAIYRGAVECPICFLYYPPNINHSRCCDQAICTECFVQIKRAEPNPTHLVSEPAACPYCVRESFGVVYTPPSWRAGLGSEGASPKQPEASPTAAMKRPRKSFGADSPEVVTIDQIRPDWEAKLAAVRAAVARRANRRIIMRQVGDRLVPVGISSGRVHALAPEEGGQAENAEGAVEPGGGRSRRSRRRQQNQDLNQLLGTMGIAGQDLEELMIMEAMRLSLVEHEEQQRKQREEEEKKKREQGGEGAQSQAAGSASSLAPLDTTSAAGPSSAPTLESVPSQTSMLASSTPITPVSESPTTQSLLAPAAASASASVSAPTSVPIAHSPASSTTPDASLSPSTPPAADGDSSRPHTPPSVSEPS
ncbi:uncharacterized protein B0H18DRAFT_829925, partial [Fomitopsis serialis]|uniref:uncharacterized protein n=1 Tax=Fomitopsis serialis TaxID=139415 RepID=UPI00200803D0